MQTLRVTAYLYNGFTSRFPWAPSIDGILAWSERRAALGVDVFTMQQQDLCAQVPNENLPLERIESDGWWWYACSNPLYTAPVRARFLHKRFNMPESEKWTDAGKVETTKGPLKNYRMLHELRVTQRVDWHCIGDAAAIESLLRPVTAIGGKLGAGYGRVRKWTVTPDGDETLARLHRPLPVEYARAHGIEGLTLVWGIRTPQRLPENQTLCVIPDAEPR